jgi:hypothetical protein
MKKLYITLLTLAFCLNGKAQTIVPGGYVYGTWTLAGSPYLIQGSLEVPNDSTLTIQPGVTVNFQGHYKLIVLGRLLAIGTQTDSIFFTASNTTTGWYGIRFDSTTANNDTSKISYCDLQWGIANGTGYDAAGGAFMFNYFSKAIVSNCLIKNDFHWAISCNNGSSPVISSNIISYCSYGGINSVGSPNISGNIISYNSGEGISGGASRLFNNIISHNAGCGIVGGGLNITYNTISYNNSSAWAGGIYSGGGPNSGTISHNIISYNTYPGGGAYSAGICCYDCGAIITDNLISNNSSPCGSGINLCGGMTFTPTISNNVIINNTATGATGIGGGIAFLGASNPIIANNTIANNSAVKGGGVYFNGSSPSIYNNIIYGNKASLSGDQVYINDQPSQPNFYYCDIQGGQAAFGLNGNFYGATYTNNINADPLFVSPSADTGISFDGVSANWSLQSTSPCNNTGDPVGTYPGTYPATDIAGNPRVIGSTINMGAYEQQIATGIIKNTNNNELNIYPNPNNGSFVIEPQNTLYNVHCTVYDVNGQMVLSQTINGKTSIDASSLNEGVYNISLQSNEGVVNKRLVIVR